jgi:hypothetical protein
LQPRALALDRPGLALLRPPRFFLTTPQRLFARRGAAIALLASTAGAAWLEAHPLTRQLGRSAVQLRNGSPVELAVAVCCFVLATACSALAWSRAFGSSGPLLDACGRYAVGSLVNAVTPARLGDAVRLGLFRREGTRSAVALGELELARIGALVLFGACGFGLVEGGGRWTPVVAVAVGAAGLATARIRPSATLVLASVALRTAGVGFAFAGLGVPAPAAAALIAVPLIELSALFPLTPGNALSAALVASAVVGSTGTVHSDRLSIAIALHALETLAGLSFGLAGTLVFLVRAFRPGRDGHGHGRTRLAQHGGRRRSDRASNRHQGRHGARSRRYYGPERRRAEGRAGFQRGKRPVPVWRPQTVVGTHTSKR